MAALSVLAAVLLTVWVGPASSPALAQIRTGAQLQFLHGMATFACATFMNIGGRSARHAPAQFLVGSALVAGSFYAEAAGWSSGLAAARFTGAVVLAGGWLTLAWSSKDIDRNV